MNDVRDPDRIHRFLFESTRVRGELVSLDETFRSATNKHAYPAALRSLLGEALAGAALLGSTIKVEGSISLQVQGDGPVRLLVAQCTSERTLRGLVRWQGHVAPGPLPTLTGPGRLAITIDPGGDRERYQGIVELIGDSLAASIETYFAQSEQLETRLWLACDETRSAGMLLQKLPGEDDDPDLWNRVVHLGSTITSAELLALPVREILRRLFHEEDVRLFAPEPVAFRCGCARTTIESVLRALGREEADSILREQGRIEVTCEYCFDRQEFDDIDVAALFADPPVSPAPTTRH